MTQFNMFVPTQRAVLFLNGDAIKDVSGTMDGGEWRELHYGEIHVMGFTTKPDFVAVEHETSREPHIPVDDVDTVTAMIRVMADWLRERAA